jgi:hypothetical protein
MTDFEFCGFDRAEGTSACVSDKTGFWIETRYSISPKA